MKLSTKGRYAVLAMADLASQGEGEPIPLAAISERQNISLSYLEQLFGKLRRARLVRSVRGPGGGYTLARSMSQISIAEIMAAVDEPVKMTRCADDPESGCLDGRRCLTHHLWHALGQHIVAFLQSATLQDVVDNRFGAPLTELVRQADALKGGLNGGPNGQGEPAEKGRRAV